MSWSRGKSANPRQFARCRHEDRFSARTNETTSAVALSTDLDEITMAASYLALGIGGAAVYRLFTRKLQRRRSYLIAAGIAEAARSLTAFALDPPALEYLRSTGVVRADALEGLAAYGYPATCGRFVRPAPCSRTNPSSKVAPTSVNVLPRQACAAAKG